MTHEKQSFDIKAEQKLIEEHDHIIFQFPYYWYHSPALLKKWLDEVLTHGWAYWSKSGFKFGGKKVALAISLGLKEEHLQHGTVFKYTLEELTRPFEALFDYIKADYQPFFAYYGMTFEPSQEWIERSVPLYLDFLERFNSKIDDVNVA
ncbi:NAD(P)H-dependent oxidoreductase [Flavobacterium sp.]|uniref:NAD(P)H-dependent oxidoreductase n=1 Tax=Flavobacterium sp. TaxID=239 RepID=UPI0031E2CBC5